MVGPHRGSRGPARIAYVSLFALAADAVVVAVEVVRVGIGHAGVKARLSEA
jgi:hypothetical protein